MPDVIEKSISSIKIKDVTGQKEATIRNVPSEATVNEVVRQLLSDMQIPTSDGEGRPLNFSAHLDRESRRLGPNERCGDALESGDSIRLMPSIDAG